MDMYSGVEPRPVLGGLAPLYRFTVPFSWAIVRFGVGLNLVMHGYPKVLKGPAVLAANYTSLGLEPGLWWAIGSTWVEFAGGIAIILGLFTRFFAAAVAIEMAMITIMYVPNGFSWLGRGYEYTLLWGFMCFAIALRGGGPFSVDRLIKREL